MMSGLRLSTLSVACLVTGMACTPRSPDLASVRDSVLAVNQRFEEAFKALDAQAMAGLYAEDGMVLPPGGEPQTGRIQIQEFWATVIAGGATGGDLETDEVFGADSLAIERGGYTIAGPGGVTVDRGKYIVIWKRHNGGWQLFRDLWNSSTPPAVPDTAQAGR